MIPAISIIVPCYNVEKYLERCMKSLLNQSLENLEIILVDDGSPDKCPILCERYAQLDKRVKVIHKQNAGLGYARNSGLEIASGEFIAFVDSDDFVDFDMYSSLYAFAAKNNCEAVFCGYKKEKKTGIWIESHEFKEDIVLDKDEKISFMLGMIASPPEEKIERKYAMSVWRAIYKRDLIEKYNIRFLSEREIGSEDLPFNISFLMKSNRIGLINKMFYYYCYNGSSLTKTFKKEKFQAYVKLFNILSKEVKDITRAQLRCDRFLIGYTRSLLQIYAGSNTYYEFSYVKEICNNSIWNDISHRYKTKYVVDYFQRIFYQLLIAKQYRMLLSYCILSSRIKRHICRR